MSEDRSIDGLPNSPKKTIKQGKNHLFAIGINTYVNFKPLINARKDIEDIAQLLSDQYSFDEVQLLLDQEANKDNIIDKLDGLRRSVGPEDRLLIYYSGHGFSDNDRGFWIPVDAEQNKVSSYIANAEVHDIIQHIKARHILLISDSCFSGSLLVRDVSSDLAGNVFDDWDRNPSRYAFISGGGVVSDGKEGENSPFAGGIIKHLRDNNADAINICRLADQVTQEIRYNYRQQAEVSPIFEAGHKGGQFVFVKKQTEKDDWESALRHNNEGGYWEYKNKYPNGKYAKEAKQKLKDIGDENAWASVLNRDAAYDYSDYLDKYPDGNHALEAKNKLNEIAKADRLEKAEARKKEQERIFLLEKERKEKVSASIQKPVAQPEQTKPIKTEDTLKVKPLSSNPSKSSNFVKYVLSIIGLGIIIAVVMMLKNKNLIADPGNTALIPIDTIVSTTVTEPMVDASREIEGKVLDSKTTPNPLIGATVLNKRTGTSTTTDGNGNFKLSGAKDGDTLLTTHLNFSNAINIILKDQKSETIQLQETPRNTENKTVSGTVTDRNGNVIKGAWIYIKRNGQMLKTYTHTNNSGKYTLTKVNEGDVLWIDAGTKYKKKSFIINSSNEYPWIVN